MNLLYNIGINAYRLAVKAVSPWNPKARRMLAGQNETIARLRRELTSGEGCIWIHTASLGEFEQGRPLIEEIKRHNPEARIVLSFFSPSGYEVRKNYDMVDAVCYLPFDTPARVREFLDTVNPVMAIFVKYEFWGNYLSQLKRRGIPTYIISAIFRPSQMFFKPWGGMFRKMLGCFTRLYVQNEQSRQLLAGIGVENVTVAGDTRFDRVLQVRRAAREFPEFERFVGNSPTLVAGSSWEPDEDIIIPYFNARPGLKMIIAPHEFDRQRLTAIMAKINRPAVLYSQLGDNDPAAYDCVIVDCFGLLSSLYRYGTVAYVGGGFGTGIHNLNEAAVYGIPVVFGPRHQKFSEAQGLIDCGGGYAISNGEDFERIADSLLGDSDLLKRAGRNADKFIAANTGATQRIYGDLFGPKQA